MLTQELLKERLTYDPDSGVFRALVKRKQINVGDKVGCSTSKGYWRIKVNDREYSAHLLAWLYVHGRWPVRQIDHINRNRTDNRLANLREASPAENGQNRRLGTNSTSGHIGVTFAKDAGKWQASIGVNGRLRYLGQFTTVQQAADAYAEAKAQHHTFNPTV